MRQKGLGVSGWRKTQGNASFVPIVTLLPALEQVTSGVCISVGSPSARLGFLGEVF